VHLTAPRSRALPRTGLRARSSVDREAFGRGQFKDEGGFTRIDKDFEGRQDEVLGDLWEAIWERAG
jgi:type I restriction enzyme, R subunit